MTKRETKLLLKKLRSWFLHDPEKYLHQDITDLYHIFSDAGVVVISDNIEKSDIDFLLMSYLTDCYVSNEKLFTEAEHSEYINSRMYPDLLKYVLFNRYTGDHFEIVDNNGEVHTEDCSFEIGCIFEIGRLIVQYGNIDFLKYKEKKE